MTTARRRLATVVTAAVLGVGALAALVLTSQKPETMMAADGLGPKGGRALVEVLQRHGVELSVARSAAELDDVLGRSAGRDRTVFVSSSGNLTPDATRRLGSALDDASDHLVLLAPGPPHLAAFGLPLQAFPGGADELGAGCSAGPVRDGDVLVGSSARYLPVQGSGGTDLCFPYPGKSGQTSSKAHGAALAVVPAGDGRPETIVLGTTEAWTNREITKGSNAGLAVRALGAQPELVWYEPSLADLIASGDDGEQTWPAAVWPVLLVLAAATVAWALVRGRRFGRLVPEPLPVVVRAIETTRSRGQLYRGAQDRGHAAAVLRAASMGRLRRLLALAPASAVDAVVAAAAQRSELPPDSVRALLDGAAPTSDAALVDLARDLTALEERTRPR